MEFKLTMWNLLLQLSEKNSIIAIGTHGTIKHPADRKIFAEGLEEIVKRIEPSVIIVYGSKNT